MLKGKVFLSLVFLASSACRFTYSEEIYQIKEWKFSEDTTMQELGVNMLSLKNESDESRIGIVERNGFTKAVNVIGSNQASLVSTQYSEENEIEYIKISNYYKSVKYDHSFLKLQKMNGNWILTEYKDTSEKEIIRSVELK